VTDTLTPVLTAHWDQPDIFTLDGYRRAGGWQALPKALGMPRDEVIAIVKGSGLRGRGGAGFPTGVKWSFLPKGDGKPHYLVVNADESEPGTCKDVPLMMANPHLLIEGAAIASYAIRAGHAFIYVRGEVLHVIRRLRHAVDEAYAAGYLGRNILGSGFDLDVIVHAGAGAYICGEETALFQSIEGYRGEPRSKPPFPVEVGLFGKPTAVNNVETLLNVLEIVREGGLIAYPTDSCYALGCHIGDAAALERLRRHQPDDFRMIVLLAQMPEQERVAAAVEPVGDEAGDHFI